VRVDRGRRVLQHGFSSSMGRPAFEQSLGL
jgi:hypothetical protein